MSVLTKQPPTSPTKEQRLTSLSKHIVQFSLDSYTQLVESQRRGIQLVWGNPLLTPQEIIDALGEKALRIFQYHGGLTDYLVAISEIDGVAFTPALPTHAFTVDPTTGTITVLDEPYAP